MSGIACQALHDRGMLGAAACAAQQGAGLRVTSKEHALCPSQTVRHTLSTAETHTHTEDCRNTRSTAETHTLRTAETR